MSIVRPTDKTGRKASRRQDGGSPVRILTTLSLVALLAGCGIAYKTPSVQRGVVDGTKVRVVDMTPQNVLAANRTPYTPRAVPAFLDALPSQMGPRSDGVAQLPQLPVMRPGSLQAKLPPALPDSPYRIGIGDEVILATPQANSSAEALTGLLAAQNSREGYTVQDDGAIAVPNVGRIPLAGKTLDEAEQTVFQSLVQAQVDPAFSLEVSNFGSQHVAIGGAVKAPAVVPITLTPLRLDSALVAAGGVSAEDLNYAVIRIYRDGTLYQIPLQDFYAKPALQKIRLRDGDAVFVDAAYDLAKATAFFQQQVTLQDVGKSNLDAARSNFNTKVELDAVDRDYAYLAGEVKTQGRFALPFGRKATLADALYEGAKGAPNNTANASQIYVLRSSEDPREFGAVTAWRLDATNAAGLVMATKFDLHPNDIVFISEQPITKWNRVISQLTPSIFTTVNTLAN